jgi:hypothetical protein
LEGREEKAKIFKLVALLLFVVICFLRPKGIFGAPRMDGQTAQKEEEEKHLHPPNFFPFLLFFYFCYPS